MDDPVTSILSRRSSRPPQPPARRARGDGPGAEGRGAHHPGGRQALAIIGENIDMAHENEGAICQDSGFPTLESRRRWAPIKS